jgi:diguanylate cyclase (GGDEF)-like protein
MASTPYKVLIIQEDPKKTDFYSEAIREVADCEIDIMETPENMVRWAGRLSYHLVVIDVLNEKNESLEVLEAIKRISPDTSVIIIAEKARVEHSVAAIKLGAEDYLKKPVKLESLRLAVKRGLDRKAVFGESMNASGFLFLFNSCQMISASLDQHKIFSTIQAYLMRELKSDYSAIYTIAEGNIVRLDDLNQDSNQGKALEQVLEIALHSVDWRSQMQDQRKNYLFIDRTKSSPSLFVLRFNCVGQEDYYCVCLAPEPPGPMEVFETRLKMLRTQTDVTGKNIEQYLGVQHLVYVDDATGLYNTRYLYAVLEREITQSVATQKSFAVLFMDADYFKKINDQYGHLVGTKLLHELAGQLKRYVRGKDTVFRYGGDEFIAVLNACDLTTAVAVAERIRMSVEQATFLVEEGLKIKMTLSIGVALFPDHAGSIKDVIAAADLAMYAAKKQTRNSVTVAQTHV